MFDESAQGQGEKISLDEIAYAKSKGHEEELQQKYLYENCDENLFSKEFHNLKINANINKSNEEKIYNQMNETTNERHETDLDEILQPLCERWSPLGADYDDVVSTTSDILLCGDNNGQLYFTDSQETLNSKLEVENEEDGMRFKNMEEEQELLTTSLLALTSHFAHVQLRVRQIVEAPAQERDQLLKDLEEFAFRGVPDMGVNAQETNSNDNEENITHDKANIVLPQEILLEKQKIIIDELKSKLNLRVDEQDLPNLSHEQLKCQVDNAFGELMGPLKMKDQLVVQLKTQITDLERFIANKDFIENKFGNIEKFAGAYNSYAAKSKTIRDSDGSAGVGDLTTSCTNKFGNMEKFAGAYNSYAAKSKTIRDADGSTGVGDLTTSCTTMAAPTNIEENSNSKAHGLLNKASVLMQIFASTHLPSNAANQFQKNTLKKTNIGNHWGDLRAQLEVDIQEVAALAATLSFDRVKLSKIKDTYNNKKKTEQKIISSEKTIMKKTTLDLYKPQEEIRIVHMQSDSDEDEFANADTKGCRTIPHHMRNYAGDSIASVSKELTTAVRKNFCITLQLLMEHGLHVESNSVASNLIVPFINCFNPSANVTYGGNRHDYAEEEQQTDTKAKMHAWELIMEYYFFKNGQEYNNTPARRLMDSYNLDTAEVQSTVSAKESLLRAIGMIDSLHRPYKRSYNAYFKAFVCEGLNSHKLVEWLNIIFSCSILIERYYLPMSYVVRTGFRDSLRSIDALMKYDFNLPVDLAVRHLRNC